MSRVAIEEIDRIRKKSSTNYLWFHDSPEEAGDAAEQDIRTLLQFIDENQKSQ